jgi:hypothetical protein
MRLRERANIRPVFKTRDKADFRHTVEKFILAADGVMVVSANVS